jgi:threonine/homoserine/homoserine lactone efflux protein
MLEWLQNNAPGCFFKSTFGIDCPGCGMTRAFFALLRGNLMESLAYNPGLIPFLITIITLFIQLKIKHPRGGFVIMWMFIITTTITMISYILKEYTICSTFLEHHH